jgi:predicted nucleic acid-binding protein
VTTWPCFTEAMYLLFQAGGYPAQVELWRWRTAGRLVLHDLTGGEMDRMAALMDKYRDRPMDLADASLVAAVERLGLRRVFTLDSDFHIYRLADGSALDCVP